MKLTSTITRVVEVVGWDGGQWTRFDMRAADGAEMHLYVKAVAAPEWPAGKTLKLNAD